MRAQVVRDGDDAVGMLHVDHRIAEWTARGAALSAAQVAVPVRRRGGDERDVDAQFAGLDGARAAAVRGHHGRRRQHAA